MIKWIQGIFSQWGEKKALGYEIQFYPGGTKFKKIK